MEIPIQTKLWFNECVRVLKDTGSFYCYGNFDILSKQKVLIFDKQLNFRQNITLNKGLKSIAGRTSDKLRMFPTASEQLLYYVVQNDYDDRQLLIEPMIEIRNYLNDERKKAGFTLDEMCRFLGLNDKGHGGIAYHWCSSKQPAMIPEKHYIKLQTTGFFNIPYSELLNKMVLAKEIHKQTRYNFNLPYATTDVWDFTPDKVRYGHPTQKPQDICQRIIKASSNENDNVLIPFAGSGTEMVGYKELKTLPNGSWVLSIAILNENTIASGDYDGNIKIWEKQNGGYKEPKTLPNGSWVLSIAILNENTIASGD